ncbi:MAG: MCE family protein [Planctomycetes bacterium]|nr:MCE family protein [Planctomycetota bacterium]
MGAHARYFKIGFFVISAVTILALAVIFLGAGALLADQVLLETYLDESVQGLDVGSPVKHRGVLIGNVKEITFVRNRYALNEHDEAFFRYGRYVLVRVGLHAGAFGGRPTEEVREKLARMVGDGLRARLAAQGLTGTAYLEMDYLDPASNPPPPIAWTPATYYVPSAPSTVSRFTESAHKVFTGLEKVDLPRFAENIDRSVATLARLLDEEVTPTMRNLRETSDLVARAVREDLGPLTRDVASAAAELPETVAQMRRTLRRLDQLTAAERDTVEETTENLRAVSADLRGLADAAKRHPSQVLFGEAPPKPDLAK